MQLMKYLGPLSLSFWKPSLLLWCRISSRKPGCLTGVELGCGRVSCITLRALGAPKRADVGVQERVRTIGTEQTYTHLRNLDGLRSKEHLLLHQGLIWGRSVKEDVSFKTKFHPSQSSVYFLVKMILAKKSLAVRAYSWSADDQGSRARQFIGFGMMEGQMALGYSCVIGQRQTVSFSCICFVCPFPIGECRVRGRSREKKSMDGGKK